MAQFFYFQVEIEVLFLELQHLHCCVLALGATCVQLSHTDIVSAFREIDSVVGIDSSELQSRAHI